MANSEDHRSNQSPSTEDTSNRNTVTVDSASPLPPEATDPWEVKERVAVEVSGMSGRRLQWRPEEIGAPHMKGFLFDPACDD